MAAAILQYEALLLSLLFLNAILSKEVKSDCQLECHKGVCMYKSYDSDLILRSDACVLHECDEEWLSIRDRVRKTVIKCKVLKKVRLEARYEVDIETMCSFFKSMEPFTIWAGRSSKICRPAATNTSRLSNSRGGERPENEVKSDGENGVTLHPGSSNSRGGEGPENEVKSDGENGVTLHPGSSNSRGGERPENEVKSDGENGLTSTLRQRGMKTSTLRGMSPMKTTTGLLQLDEASSGDKENDDLIISVSVSVPSAVLIAIAALIFKRCCRRRPRRDLRVIGEEIPLQGLPPPSLDTTATSVESADQTVVTVETSFSSLQSGDQASNLEEVVSGEPSSPVASRTRSKNKL